MSSQKVDSLHICAISDGRAGNARQAEALAAALAEGHDVDLSAFTLSPRAPWRWAAPRRWPGVEQAFGPEFAALLAAPPDIAIGCGRQAALATRLLRERGARVVQILDPRLDPSHWDVVVVPEHDRLHGPKAAPSNEMPSNEAPSNEIRMLGSLHPVDDPWLAHARETFAAFAALPAPRTAFLIGGTSAHARFDRMAFEVMASKFEAVLARDGGSVLLTTSRRTPKELRDVLRHRYDGTPGVVWRDDSDGPNPYSGLLAWADRIVCSPDSVNMISEACATRAPVFVFDPQRVQGRPRAFLDALLARGRIRTMDARLDAFDVEPLRETARVAADVCARLTPG
jgi:mitochondrial fission protein ELM1